MAHVVVMYKTPKDAAAFDKHYAEAHIPIAKKLPGLQNMKSAAVRWRRLPDPRRSI